MYALCNWIQISLADGGLPIGGLMSGIIIGWIRSNKFGQYSEFGGQTNGGLA